MTTAITDELEELRALRDSAPEHYISGLIDLCRRVPDSVEVQIEAAFAHDGAGDEAQALRHYEAAHQLGVPSEHDCAFTLSYGAALNSCSRGEEALAILGQGAIDHPDYAPMRVILAVALCNHGHGREAVAMLLEVVLMLGDGDDVLDGYEEVFAGLQWLLLQPR